MANPYVSPSISGYNTNPPSDDGSQTSNNEITWAKHKTKIGDPLKTYADAISQAVSAAIGKTLLIGGVSAISSGHTVTDANRGKLLACSNTITVTLPASSEGFEIAIQNVGTGTVTIDGDGDETINGDASITLAPDASVILVPDGSNWYALGAGFAALAGANIFTADQTIRASSGSADLTLHADHDTPSLAGTLKFTQDNDAGAEVVLGRVVAVSSDLTAGSEDSVTQITSTRGGTDAARLNVAEGIYAQGATGGDPGAGKFNAGGYEKNGTEFEGVTVWVNFNGTLASNQIRNDFNVSSITDSGTGTYRVNFSTALVNSTYAATGHAAADNTAFFPKGVTLNDKSTSGIDMFTTNLTTGVLEDASLCDLIISGGA